MRVIGGQFRSRRLKTLPGEALRPTPDRLREALFNVLAPEIEGAVFLDAYAGSGAVGIEALSRGAARAIFIEADRAAVRVIRENLASLGLEDRAEVVHGQALKRLGNYRADIAFLDPPYALSREYGPALMLLAQNPPRLVVVQHDRRHELEPRYGCLRRVRQLRQGNNALSFYRPQDES
jgi:16S rRNA (guanine(966)-N(2))-methyltransferase RsmD